MKKILLVAVAGSLLSLGLLQAKYETEMFDAYYDHQNNNETKLNQIKKYHTDGADINSYSKYGSTLLIQAASSNQLDIVKYLLQYRRVDIDAKNKTTGNTALITAVKYSHNPKMVQYLVDQGANINALNNEKKSALKEAEESVAFSPTKTSVEILEILKNAQGSQKSKGK